jgi:histone deacetylase 6
MTSLSYCYLKKCSTQQEPDKFSLNRILKGKPKRFQQSLLSKEQEEQLYRINIADVEQQYNISNVYFEQEDKKSIILNDILEPFQVYIVHGDSNDKEAKEQTSKEHKRTVIAFDKCMLYHFGRASHPEKPARLSEIWRLIEEEGLNKKCQVIEGTLASEQDLLLVHTAEHVEGVKYQGSKLYNPNHNYESNSAHREFKMSSDVFYNENSAQAAFCAAGSTIDIVERVLKGIDGAKNGFAIIRPPGHHAYRDRASGFCIFNNAAVAAKAAICRMNAKRVMIVDWDVHHGNGTEDILNNEPNILYFSIHRHSGFYPGTGAVEDVGIGLSKGKIVNIPFADYKYGDGDILFVFQHLLLPIAYEFNPDLVIVSAGFDAVEGDPLGEMKLTPQIYGHMTHLLQALANGKIVLCLEGGYKCEVIGHCVLECLKVLSGTEGGPSSIPLSYGSIANNSLLPSECHMPLYKRIITTQANYWQCMKLMQLLIH